MDYLHLPLLVDLSDRQAGADLNVMSSAVDGVIVKMGEANPDDHNNPKYDPSFHVHINNAYHAKPKRLPAGAYYILNTNMWNGYGFDALLDLKRMENPNYKFIYDTIQNKAVNFLCLILQHPMSTNQSASGWLMRDLDVLYKHLRQGMAVKPVPEIPPMPIVICSSERYIDTYIGQSFYSWVQERQNNTVDVTKNEIQVWTQDYSFMAAIQDVWDNVRKYVPPSTAKPPYLNGIPNWFLWQFGSVLLPKDAAGNPMWFGVNMSFVTLERLHTWMKYTPAVVIEPPPIDTTCLPGYHWDAIQGKCVIGDDLPPIVPSDMSDFYAKKVKEAEALLAAYAYIAKVYKGQV